METKSVAEIIIDSHKASLPGIWNILKSRKTFLKWYYVLGYLVAVLFTFITYEKNDNHYDILIRLIDTTLTVFPTLCGFSLSGFSIIINMGNQQSWKDTATYKDGEYSLYQKVIAIFSACVLFQILVVVLSFCIRLSDKTNFCFSVPNHLANIINTIVFLLVTLFSVTALIMVFFIITNLFTAGQYIDSKSTIEKYKKENPNS